MKFYLDSTTNNWIVQKKSGFPDMRVTPGFYNLEIAQANDHVSVYLNSNPSLMLFDDIDVTDIEKNAAGEFYADIDEFLTASSDFFVRATGGGGISSVSQNHIFDSTTERDEYFDPTLPSGNPTDNTSELITGVPIIVNVGTPSVPDVQFQVWGGTNDPASYDNTLWVNAGQINVSAALFGLLTNLNNISTTYIPVKAATNYEDSSIRETSTQIISDKEIVTTPTSIIFGQNGAEIASSGQALLFEGTNDSDAFIIMNAYEPLVGSQTFFRSRTLPRGEYTIQSLKNVTSSDNPSFTYTVNAIGSTLTPAIDDEDRRHTDQVTVESENTGEATVTFRETDQNGKLLRLQTVNFTADTEQSISLVKPICLDVGTVVHVSVTGTSTAIQLKGTTISSKFAPFLKIRSYLGYTDKIATEDTMNLFSSEIRDALQTLSGTNRLDASFIQNIPSAGLDDDAIHDNVAGEINAITEKTTPVGSDILVIEDSADSNNKKKVQITNLPFTNITNENVRDVIGNTLVAGSNITIDVNDAADTITINASGTGGTTPTPVSTDLRYGLSALSDPSLIDFGSLIDVPSPTDPITVSTGTTSAGQYFHIFSSNTHDIQTITDTVLQQIVYQEGGTGNIFTKQSDVRTEGSITYDSYTIGPLNAGIDEDYVLAFS